MSLPLTTRSLETYAPSLAVRAGSSDPVVRLVPEPEPELQVAPELEDEDGRWVLAAQRGEQWAFEHLVRKHQRHAMAIALGLVKDEHDACEIVQEAFLRVHRGLQNFQRTASFFTWLYRIVTNLSIDLMRKPMRRETEPLDQEMLEKATEAPCLANMEGDPFENLCRRELVARIDASVDELPPYHRGVILMREIDGLSYEEMALKMGVSKGTIMSRLFHARQKLQRSLVVDYAEQTGCTPALASEPLAADSAPRLVIYR